MPRGTVGRGIATKHLQEAITPSATRLISTARQPGSYPERRPFITASRAAADESQARFEQLRTACAECDGWPFNSVGFTPNVPEQMRSVHGASA